MVDASAMRVVEPLRPEADAHVAPGQPGGRLLAAADARRGVMDGVKRSSVATAITDRLVLDANRLVLVDRVRKAHAPNGRMPHAVWGGTSGVPSPVDLATQLRWSMKYSTK